MNITYSHFHKVVCLSLPELTVANRSHPSLYDPGFNTARFGWTIKYVHKPLLEFLSQSFPPIPWQNSPTINVILILIKRVTSLPKSNVDINHRRMARSRKS